jgi:hypothetical protein
VFYLSGKIDRIFVKPKTKMSRMIVLVENAIGDTKNISRNFSYFSIWPLSIFFLINPDESYVTHEDTVTLNKHIEQYNLQAEIRNISPTIYLILVFPKERVSK